MTVQDCAAALVPPSSSATRLPAPTICATRYRTETATEEVPAAIRTGRSLIRDTTTSASVNRPQLRTSSATRNSTTSQATRNPTEYSSPSYPKRAISPEIPRKDAADM
ncbi:hypothetical protein SALBM311S_02536 [Streptomyces alboniger]